MVPKLRLRIEVLHAPYSVMKGQTETWCSWNRDAWQKECVESKTRPIGSYGFSPKSFGLYNCTRRLCFPYLRLIWHNTCSDLLHSTPLYSYPNYLKAEGRSPWSPRSWSFCQSSALSALSSSISKPTEHPKLSSFSGGSAQPGQTSSWRGDRSIAGSDE